MAKELARIAHEKMRDEKMRQYIKENRCLVALQQTLMSINFNISTCSYIPIF